MDNDNVIVVDGDTLKKKSKPKILWDNSTFMVFIESCMTELRNGNRPGTHFSKLGWANIQKNINAQTGRNLDKKQLKNKWDTMRKEWKIYDRLMRIESGISFDTVRKTIIASPEWWDEKIKGDKEYAKFRDKNLEVYQTYYEALFRDSVAIGDMAKAPSELVGNNTPNDVQIEDVPEGKGDSDDVNLFDDVEPFFPQASSSKRKKLNTIPLSRVTKGKTTTSSFEEKLDTVLEAISTKSTQTSTLANPSPTTDECMDIVTCFPGLAHGCGNRFVQEAFNHSGETIHRHFHKVLNAVLKLSRDLIRPNANFNEDVPEHILHNSRYYPYFKDCIGAIDGTHVRASVRESEQVKYIGRKGHATQNIMAACDFNMCFTFVWAGWEGTAHDTRIFNEALKRRELNFPHPVGAKYYVVDAGYPNTRGYLAPYKGTNIRYHIREFRRGETDAARQPRGFKETFNYYHSSLRNVIERTFGVWKARWAILKDMHVNYTYETQVNIVIASMALHNYIRMHGSGDEAFHRAQEESYIPRRDREAQGGNEANEEDSSVQRKIDDTYMSAVRDMIAGEIHANLNRRSRNRI